MIFFFFKFMKTCSSATITSYIIKCSCMCFYLYIKVHIQPVGVPLCTWTHDSLDSCFSIHPTSWNTRIFASRRLFAPSLEGRVVDGVQGLPPPLSVVAGHSQAATGQVLWRGHQDSNPGQAHATTALLLALINCRCHFYSALSSHPGTTIGRFFFAAAYIQESFTSIS